MAIPTSAWSSTSLTETDSPRTISDRTPRIFTRTIDEFPLEILLLGLLPGSRGPHRWHRLGRWSVSDPRASPPLAGGSPRGAVGSPRSSLGECLLKYKESRFR